MAGVLGALQHCCFCCGGADSISHLVSCDQVNRVLGALRLEMQRASRPFLLADLFFQIDMDGDSRAFAFAGFAAMWAVRRRLVQLPEAAATLDHN